MGRGVQISAASVEGIPHAAEPRSTIIVNADDWGMRLKATDRILDCVRHGSVSSTSAMVFMEDSERGAELAREYGVDAGLHLNLTEAFTAKDVPARLREEHVKLMRFLRKGRRGKVVPNPLLAGAFEYVVKEQLEEFERLYGAKARHIDGHHHAHLAANVRGQKLLPQGTMVRRNFTFAAGEKSWLKLRVRAFQDRQLARRHSMTEYFFDIAPLEETRLRRVLELARTADVEIECHPERDAEYDFLMSDGLAWLGYAVTVTQGYRLRGSHVSNARVREEDAVKTPHVAVCICTYKRPAELKRLLRDLDRQKTDGLFTYSVVVADNDAARSGETAVEEMRGAMRVPVKYCAEPEKGIARARNRVIGSADGDYFALIDDDEFPEPDWLLTLLKRCREYGVDGVLGPVKRYLDDGAPQWLKRSSLYDRAVQPTGKEVEWRGARTGNALLKSAVFAGNEQPFDVKFAAGEDQDFFRKKIEEGRRFVWVSDAVVWEELPPARWKRSYFLRKAMLYGSYAAKQPDCGAKSVLKSLVAMPLYTLALPFALLAGQHRFMTLLVKLCDHLGKLLSLMGIRPFHDEHVSE
ncbi:ChbG/HpnK family deacetylase [Occallatibacter riparius]|uniref:ChbG/HpnK family deacetylase n=1 Tax=Occallatibacter riparius TaxID=1002689 RepID=A0A9J7BWR6_9BACT|nr:ChbG/HpnK family deacetylase [Occallatibacter riparius]UWZ86929.1 ChbG/HpnK family deacetylase [Occallatibacter riparius]